METESAAARQAKESLELAFQMSQILDTGLDRHTLSLLMALCDRRQPRGPRRPRPRALLGGSSYLRRRNYSRGQLHRGAVPKSHVAVPLRPSPTLGH
uniref:Uncharacterized protein n=1 Tax=Oryza brachyantha TaxID=4533 RepID=J3LUA8_ORYBR